MVQEDVIRVWKKNDPCLMVLLYTNEEEEEEEEIVGRDEVGELWRREMTWNCIYSAKIQCKRRVGGGVKWF